MPPSRRTQVLLWFGIVAAAAAIIVLTRRTPSDLTYEDELLRAEDAVRVRQDAVLKRFDIGNYDRFDWSQEHGLIVFSTAGIPKVVAEVQFVGSYSEVSKTWLWAWANDSVDARVKHDSERVKAFGLERGLKRLIEPKWSATEQDGWEMATFQAHVTGADMLYRTPSKQGKTYLALHHVRSAPPGARYPFVPSK